MGLSNSKNQVKKIYPKKIKGKNICILQGWIGLFFLEQKENLLQISPVPHRSNFFNFLFQIVKWGNFAETLMYNTLCFTFASPEIKKKTGSGLTMQWKVRWWSGGQVGFRWMSVECQVNVKSQSELDIGGHETCEVLYRSFQIKSVIGFYFFFCDFYWGVDWVKLNLHEWFCI